jgi:L-lactate utilization protein LutB
METIKSWYLEDRAKRAAEALKKRGFKAFYVENQAQAKEMILKEIPPGAVVGIGGSVTIRGLKVIEELRAKGHKVLDHWEVPHSAAEESFQMRRAQQASDVFLTSSNAITLEGQLVNIDGSGNRVNAMTFGPRKAIVAAGINKIVPDLESALRRIKEVAVPMNCRRLNFHPPCIQAGKCVDCRVPQRACRITSIIEWKPPFFSDYLVILIGEELGF